MRKILTNWKTTISGALALVAVGLYWANKIDSTQFASGIGLLTSAGLILSQDAR